MKRVFAIVVGSCLLGSVGFSAELAKVNGIPISDTDLKMSLVGLNEGQRDSLLKDRNTRNQILQNLIDQEVLSQAAEKEKLDKDPEFQRAMTAFRKQYLASQMLQKNVVSKLTPSAIRQYYESKKSKFNSDRVHVQHILVTDEKQARDLAEQAKAGTEDFQALAEKYSIDPSAKNNRGDLGLITHESPFVDEFKNAAFSATSGQIVGPVKSLYGYHVIKVVEKKIGKTLGFDEVEVKAKNALQSEKAQLYVSQLRAQSKVEVNSKAVDKM